MTPIYTQTASGSSSTITFNSIPQFYTDLLVEFSVRSTRASSVTDDLYINFNNVTSANTQHSVTNLWGNGSTVGSSRGSSTWLIGGPVQPAATGTANTYASGSFYIPNYTGSNYKSIVFDAINENNTSTLGTGSGLNLEGGLYSSSSAITAISFLCGYANFTNASTFSLYGLIRQGA